jgi:hypothetical protein
MRVLHSGEAAPDLRGSHRRSSDQVIYAAASRLQHETGRSLVGATREKTAKLVAPIHAYIRVGMRRSGRFRRILLVRAWPGIDRSPRCRKAHLAPRPISDAGVSKSLGALVVRGRRPARGTDLSGSSARNELYRDFRYQLTWIMTRGTSSSDPTRRCPNRLASP